jgi:hypothetical protein
MSHLIEASERMSRDRLSECVSAACYGSVLVLAFLAVIGGSEVAEGHSAELIAGVGLATWIAHLFAELLGEHIRYHEPVDRKELARAAVDGSPILASTVLPAVALLLGRLDVITDQTARVAAIVVALVQLASVGAFVARVAPVPRTAAWTFGPATAGVGIVVVGLTVSLGH